MRKTIYRFSSLLLVVLLTVVYLPTAVLADTGKLLVAKTAAQPNVTADDFTYTTYKEKGETKICITQYTGTKTEVVMPYKLNNMVIGKIDDDAFYGNLSITSVVISEGVTSIGDAVFFECLNLKSITIPEGVTSIGEYAFDYCSSLESIILPKGLTSISNDLFSNCFALESITIPDSVTSIGDSAFNFCNSITSITIPKNVTKIGIIVFANCSSVESITVESGNTVYHSAGNCLIETKSKTLIFACKNSIIPTDGSVTLIGHSAFNGCRALKNITIPQGVTSIGIMAFSDCDSLTSIIIPQGVTIIDWSAFSRCSVLESVTLPESLNSIGNYAFESCSALKKIAIPVNITLIEDDTFAFCNSLESISVAIGNTVYRSDGNCLIETTSKTLILGCENSIIPTDGSVTSIGNSAFSSCDSLTSIVIPESVTSISDNSFPDRTSFTTIYGKKGSYAEEYANDNGYTFINLTAQKHLSELLPTDIKIKDGILYYNYKSIKASRISVNGVKVYDAKGTELTSDTFIGTGCVIKLVNANGEVIEQADMCILGDMSGDGKLNAYDYLILKRAVLGTHTLEGVYAKAGCVSGGDKFTVKDYMMLKMLC